MEQAFSSTLDMLAHRLLSFHCISRFQSVNDSTVFININHILLNRTPIGCG